MKKLLLVLAGFLVVGNGYGAQKTSLQDALKKQIEVLKKQIEASEKHNATVEKQVDELIKLNQHLSKKVQECEERLQQSHRENDEIHQQLETALTLAQDAQKTLKIERVAYKEQINKLETELNQLKAKVSQAGL